MQVAGLLVAETAAEQESSLRQRLQLGWPGVGGANAHAGSWTAGRRAYCWAAVHPKAEVCDLAGHQMSAEGHRCQKSRGRLLSALETGNGLHRCL